MTEKVAASLPLPKKKVKDPSKNNSVGPVYLKILGNGAPGGHASFYVVTDHSCYVFNCGEGFQRLAREVKMRLTKLENIFITRNTWEMTGGLPGVAFAQEGQVPNLTLHGPPGLGILFEAASDFIYTPNLKIDAPVCCHDTRFEDHAMTVDYIPIRPLLEQQSSQNSLISMCFVCTLKDTPGILLIDRCRQLGVPSGPLLGRLKAGHDVTLKDGTIVSSAEVTSDDIPGRIFLVIDCPTEDHMETMVTSGVWSKFQKNLSSHHHTPHHHPDNKMPDLIVHFTPPKILSHPTYLEWMTGFDPTTQHIVLNESCHILASPIVHQLQGKLNTIDGQIFPLLYSHDDDDDPLVGTKMSDLKPARVIFPDTHLTYQLRPHLGLNVSQPPKMAEKIDLAATNLSFLPAEKNLNNEKFPKILFLGTGSCVPSGGRNVSGILVEMTKTCKMFLDCGEGSYGQLVRFFGVQKATKILAATNAIYISHLHADHHLGLLTLLKKRDEAIKNFGEKTTLPPMPPLFLMAPMEILNFLTAYSKNFEPISDTYKLIPNLALTHDYDGSDGIFMVEEMLNFLNLETIQTVLVDHCPNAFGVSVKAKDYKITYSGDTLPCPGLVELGLNSDLLIHEATMEDELIEDAETKKHSTTSQAIEMGQKMNAKFTILTHFSQRYPTVPKIDGGDGGANGLPQNVGIAFDNMRVTLTDLPRLSLMYPQLKVMFSDDLET